MYGLCAAASAGEVRCACVNLVDSVLHASACCTAVCFSCDAIFVHKLIMRPSSLGGGRILRRTLSVRLSVRPVIERHVAPPSELQ